MNILLRVKIPIKSASSLLLMISEVLVEPNGILHWISDKYIK